MPSMAAAILDIRWLPPNQASPRRGGPVMAVSDAEQHGCYRLLGVHPIPDMLKATCLQRCRPWMPAGCHPWMPAGCRPWMRAGCRPPRTHPIAPRGPRGTAAGCRCSLKGLGSRRPYRPHRCRQRLLPLKLRRARRGDCVRRTGRPSGSPRRLGRRGQVRP